MVMPELMRQVTEEVQLKKTQTLRMKVRTTVWTGVWMKELLNNMSKEKLKATTRIVTTELMIVVIETTTRRMARMSTRMVPKTVTKLLERTVMSTR